MGRTTVVIAGIPQYVTLTDIACNLDHLFSNAVNEVGDFHLRDLPNNACNKARQIAVDFDSSYSAMVAQKILDEYEYKLPNGKQYILHADISRTKVSVREIGDDCDSSIPENITYKNKHYRDGRFRVVSKSYEMESTTRKYDIEIDEKLKILKKQKELLSMQREVLKEKKKLKKEMKDFKCSESEETEEDSSEERYETKKSSRSKHSRSKSRHHHHSSSSSESSEEEIHLKKHSYRHRDYDGRSKIQRKRERSRSRCRSKEQHRSRRRRSRSLSTPKKHSKYEYEYQNRSYKWLQKEEERSDGRNVVYASRKRHRSRSPYHYKDRRRSVRADKYSRSRSHELPKEKTYTPKEGSSSMIVSTISKPYNDSHVLPSSSDVVEFIHEEAAKVLMRESIQIMLYHTIMKEKIKLPPKDFKMLYMLLTKSLIRRLQHLPIIENESVRDIVLRYKVYYNSKDNYSMIRNIMDNFRSDVIILDDEDEIVSVRNRDNKFSRSEKSSLIQNEELEDKMIIEEEDTQQIVLYCPNPSLKRVREANENMDSPLLPPFVPCNTQENEENIEREIPLNPRFVLPTRVLLKQMRFLLSELGFDQQNGSTKKLRRVIRKELRSIMAGKDYMNTGSIIRLFREHHPKTDDKEYLQSILDNIKAGVYPDEDSDAEDVCSDKTTIPKQTITNQDTNHETTETKDMASINAQTSEKPLDETKENSKIVYPNVIDTNNDDIIEITKPDTKKNTVENNCNDAIEFKNINIACDNAIDDVSKDNLDLESQINLNSDKDQIKINENSVRDNDIKKDQTVLPVKILLKEMKEFLIDVDDSKLDTIKSVIRERFRQLLKDRENINYKALVSLFREYHPKDDDKKFIGNIMNNFRSGEINKVKNYVEIKLRGNIISDVEVIKETTEEDLSESRQEVANKHFKGDDNAQKCNAKLEADAKDNIEKELSGNHVEVTDTKSTDSDPDNLNDDALIQSQADVTEEILNEIVDELHSEVKDDDDLSILTVSFNMGKEYNRSTEDLLKVLSDN